MCALPILAEQIQRCPAGTRLPQLAQLRAALDREITATSEQCAQSGFLPR